jgi:hypothetical protein
MLFLVGLGSVGGMPLSYWQAIVQFQSLVNPPCCLAERTRDMFNFQLEHLGKR